MTVDTSFQVEKLLNAVGLVANALEKAAISYQVVGGFAVFLHSEPINPLAAAITPKVKIIIDARQVGRLEPAMTADGIAFRAIGNAVVISASDVAPGLVGSIEIDTCVWTSFPQTVRSSAGVFVMPVLELVQTLLKRSRLEDQLLLHNLDHVRLITSQVEAGLSEPLRARLAEVRATE